MTNRLSQPSPSPPSPGWQAAYPPRETADLSDPMARSLLSLLDRAALDLTDDPENARQTIGRAISLLRIEVERRGPGSRISELRAAAPFGDVGAEETEGEGWPARRPADSGRAATRPKDVSQGELATWQVSRVTRYIDTHLAERIQVRDLSAVARRSTAHFCRLFKRTLGETPHSFITRCRLLRAQQLMLTGDRPLSEIAIACGFADQAHFCHRFRQMTGVSPTAWRRERRDMHAVPTPALPTISED